MKRTLIPAVLLLFIYPYISAQTIRLKRSDSYPESENDYYFRVLPDIAIVNDLLFGVENWSHKVLLFSVNEGIEFIKEIGRQGQGPGEFRLPFKISVWNNEILIKDDLGYSFLDNEGNFKSKFVLPAYGSGSVCLYAHDKIYTVNLKIEDSHFFDIFSKTGKQVSKSGTKYLEVDGSKYQGMGPYGIGRTVYEGNLLSDGECIFYVNFKFGHIRKYNSQGGLISAADYSHYFGEHGRKTLEFCRKTFINNGIKLTRTNRMIPAAKIIRDAYLYKSILYLMESNSTPEIKEKKKLLRIIAFDGDTLEFNAQYAFDKDDENRVFCFAVSGTQGKPVFFVHMAAEDYIIAEYIIDE